MDDPGAGEGVLVPQEPPVLGLLPRLEGPAILRAADLAGLLDWARRGGVDLTGLQVGPPSLEEAYLVLTGDADRLRREPSHA